MVKSFNIDWKERKKQKKAKRLRDKLLIKQEKLMEELIRENNERIMNSRGYFGIYDKKGNLLCIEETGFDYGELKRGYIADFFYFSHGIKCKQKG